MERTHRNRLTYQKVADGVFKVNGVLYITKQAFDNGLVQLDREEKAENEQ